MFKTIRTWAFGMLACTGLAFNRYAAEPISHYLYSAWMYASADASTKFEKELALQASLPQETLAATQSGLVRDSHGYMQYSASEALLSLTT